MYLIYRALNIIWTLLFALRKTAAAMLARIAEAILPEAYVNLDAYEKAECKTVLASWRYRLKQKITVSCHRKVQTNVK
jgi:uncharacterized membrane protein